jgi:hypothetical protein
LKKNHIHPPVNKTVLRFAKGHSSDGTAPAAPSMPGFPPAILGYESVFGCNDFPAHVLVGGGLMGLNEEQKAARFELMKREKVRRIAEEKARKHENERQEQRALKILKERERKQREKHERRR